MSFLSASSIQFCAALLSLNIPVLLSLSIAVLLSLSIPVLLSLSIPVLLSLNIPILLSLSIPVLLKKHVAFVLLYFLPSLVFVLQTLELCHVFNRRFGYDTIGTFRYSGTLSVQLC